MGKLGSTSSPSIQKTRSWGSSGPLPHDLYRRRARGEARVYFLAIYIQKMRSWGSVYTSPRATRLARSRKRVLPTGAHQFKLDLTACDRRGTRRVGRAQRGGAGLSCLAVACGAVPTLNGTRELHKLHKCLGMRRNPWQCHEPAEPMGDRHDAHVASTEPVPPERGRCVAHGRSDSTTAPQGDASCARTRAAGIF